MTEDNDGIPQIAPSLPTINKDIQGKVYPLSYSVKLDGNTGIGAITIPGGTNVVFRHGGEQMIKDEVTHNALLVWVNHPFPINTAMPVRYPAKVLDPNTIALPIPIGFNPEAGKNLPGLVSLETDRLGDELQNMNNSFKAMSAHIKGIGSGMMYVAVTIRNLPQAFVADGSFQDKMTLDINKRGLTVITDSTLYCAVDTTDPDLRTDVHFNTTE